MWQEDGCLQAVKTNSLGAVEASTLTLTSRTVRQFKSAGWRYLAMAPELPKILSTTDPQAPELIGKDSFKGVLMIRVVEAAHGGPVSTPESHSASCPQRVSHFLELLL
jgi:hypothetical protein